MVNGDLCTAKRVFLVCTLEFSVTKKEEGMCLCSLLLLAKGVGLTVLRIRTFCMDNPRNLLRICEAQVLLPAG